MLVAWSALVTLKHAKSLGKHMEHGRETNQSITRPQLQVHILNKDILNRGREPHRETPTCLRYSGKQWLREDVRGKKTPDRRQHM